MWPLWIAGALASLVWFRRAPALAHVVTPVPGGHGVLTPAGVAKSHSGGGASQAPSVRLSQTLSSAMRSSIDLATQFGTATGPQVASTAGYRAVAPVVSYAPASAPSAGPPQVYIPPAYNYVPAYTPTAAPVASAPADITGAPTAAAVVSAPVDVAPVAGGSPSLD